MTLTHYIDTCPTELENVLSNFSINFDFPWKDLVLQNIQDSKRVSTNSFIWTINFKIINLTFVEEQSLSQILSASYSAGTTQGWNV